LRASKRLGQLRARALLALVIDKRFEIPGRLLELWVALV
jgi:hypothetical protein